MLPTGSIRTPLHGAVTNLPGFSEGNWWVQDAAAALPVGLFGDVRDKSVADLCAAPGGKTAQLAHAGARVTAVDRSPARVRRLQENLVRLKLAAEIVVADAAEWTHEPFDAVLVDAPCTATGTIRRHPDIAWLKQEADIAALTGLQDRLLQRAVSSAEAEGHAGLSAPARWRRRRANSRSSVCWPRISAAARADRPGRGGRTGRTDHTGRRLENASKPFPARRPANGGT